jgi:starch-binding outer membrane protein, SusD/RagB family
MRIHTLPALALAGVLAPLALAACDLDVPDLNDPSLDDLKNHPDAISIGAACTGLLIGNRGGQAAENGNVVQLGILGREAYNFDAADPRYIGELLVGELNSGSPFGGAFWSGSYANIQLGNVILGALDKVTDLPDDAKAAIRGFTKTINALDLLDVVVTHDTNGAVLDVNPDPLGNLPPIVTDTAMQYAKITGLLDDAVNDLMTAKAGGDAFPFALGKGFAGFDAPSTFLTFNRALRARVAAYTQDYAMALTALGQSFLDDDPATLDINDGVYYAYSTKPGDAASALINPNIFAHPSLEIDAEHDAMNNPIDARLLRKTQASASPPGSARATADLPKHPADNSQLPVLTFKKLYPNPESSVPLIRNEELILLEAEAKWFTNDHAGALAALNTVRTVSGKLPVIAMPANNTDFVAALLHEREFSLLFEGGHRWIDVRRFQRQLQQQFPMGAKLRIFVTPGMNGMPDQPDTLNVRFPIPLSECNARPGEPACMLGSTDG